MDEDDLFKLCVGATIGAAITFAVCYCKVEEAMKEPVRKKEAWIVTALDDFSRAAGPLLEKSEAERVALEADFAVKIESVFMHFNRANVPCSRCMESFDSPEQNPAAAHEFTPGRTRRWDPARYALEDHVSDEAKSP